MSRSATVTSTAVYLESYDFSANYRYLKTLIQELKLDNANSVQQFVCSEVNADRALTRREMKQLFRFLRRIEAHYDKCVQPPIPQELEHSIRKKDSDLWLPWELEAIEKVEAWRESLPVQEQSAERMLREALDKIRSGNPVQ